MISSEAEEDGEDSSSSTIFDGMSHQFKSALEEFREKWQKELKTDPKANESKLISCIIDNDESRAERLFKQGIDLERRGKVYDALQFYRKAVQIVPDIEFKIYETSKEMQGQQTAETNNNVNDQGEERCSYANCNDNDDEEDLSNVDLISRFQNDLTKSGRLIKRATDNGVLKTELHISELPTEIILYILRWVISTQLDMRSLEQCSAICKGLYICARDEEIWRQACSKVWGVNTGLLSNTSYISWRQMYIERERVHFNGCYISKTTYLRLGENSFQDQFYRPVQLVEYFRYFRFLPDGTVITLTTSDEPAQGVTKLKNLYQLRPEVLRGHYRLHGDLVIIMLKKFQKPQPSYLMKRRAGVADFEINSSGGNSTTYYIELEITSTPKRRFCQLQWKNYSIIQIKNKKEVTNEFELTAAKYPPLWFSRVKSYHLESDAPLQ